MELPVIEFIQTRLAEVDPDFDTRQGSAHYDLFVIPQQFMLQPFSDYMIDRRTAQSIRQILAQEDPDAWSTEDVDDLAGNLYVTRDTGALASGVVRVYYITPKDVEFPALTAQFTSGSLNFFNTADFTITAADMALQSDGSLYYIDIGVQAEAAGDEYNVEAGAITAILNDLDAVRVTNLADISGGLPTETNTTLLNRAKTSIGVRDLETVKGINAILKDLYPFLREIVSIGMGDPEMQRDILYNTHVGGKTDVYLKTPNLTTGTKTVVGLLTDETREVHRSVIKGVARNSTDPLLPPETGTPSIVVNTTRIYENVVETAASILSAAVPSGTGINLAGTEWLNLTIDDRPPVQFKVSGVNPAQTQKFEIINAINAAISLAVAAPTSSNKIRLQSPKVGLASTITFNAINLPVAPTQNACQALFGVLIGSLPYTIQGIGASEYLEGVDFEVEEADGLIYQTSYTLGTRDPGLINRQTILSGQTMIDALTDFGGGATGQITQTGSLFYLEDPTLNMFQRDPMVHVRAGDQVTIVSIGGVTTGTVNGIPLPSTYSVSEFINVNKLLLANMPPATTPTVPNDVIYTIVSNQVCRVEYDYNPISVDIGGQVRLDDEGLTRGLRPGRENYTITDTPFIKLVSIQQVDPDTEELIGSPLVPPQGYGSGGYGSGGYGVGNSGDYNFIVNSPTERFSVFEDAMIIFNQNSLSNNYLITYLYNPELQAIHQTTRNDAERVTGADVLVKTFIPCFVDIAIGIRRDPTNIATPTNDELATLVQNLVNTTLADAGLKASDIEELLMAQGVDSVRTPFDMKGTVLNPDGSTSIIESQDILEVPDVTLESQTDNFTTPRIVHFFPGTITVTEVP